MGGNRIANARVPLRVYAQPLHGTLSHWRDNNGHEVDVIIDLELRITQINGCSVCVDVHARELKKSGETDQRIWGVGACRESAYFSDAERAALDLAEHVTRLADRPDPVPDTVWDNATDHYDEKELSSLLVSIAAINVWNRLNAATRQPVDTTP